MGLEVDGSVKEGDLGHLSLPLRIWQRSVTTLAAVVVLMVLSELAKGFFFCDLVEPKTPTSSFEISKREKPRSRSSVD